MEWIGCIRCEKSRCDFLARTFALIAPVHPICTEFHALLNDPKCTQTLWNTPNMSLGSNGVDQVRWLWKITTRLRGMNFCINCTCSACFATSFMLLRNDAKCTQILRNESKHWYSVQRGGLSAFLAKIQTWHRGTNFCINCACIGCFATSFMQLRNDPKCTQILRNQPKH